MFSLLTTGIEPFFIKSEKEAVSYRVRGSCFLSSKNEMAEHIGNM
jgi:hypothetical protein